MSKGHYIRRHAYDREQPPKLRLTREQVTAAPARVLAQRVRLLEGRVGDGRGSRVLPVLQPGVHEPRPRRSSPEKDAGSRANHPSDMSGELPLFPNASRDFLAANPHLAANPNLAGSRVSSERPAHKEGPSDAVRAQLEQRPPVRAPRAIRTKAEDSKRFLVRITSVRSRLIDADNLCEKYLCDACRYSGAIPGDSPRTTEIEVAQRKVGKGEEEHTLVEIYEIL